jgi:DNA-binding FadR family transcriptional regulator
MSNASSFSRFDRVPMSAHGHVARSIGIEIISGAIPPGERLPHETELLAQFNVSRTVLREAIKTLAAKGLVTARARIGTVVTNPEQWNMFDADVLSWKTVQGLDQAFHGDLTEIRLALESRAAALAARHRSDDDLRALRSAIELMRNATESRRQFAEADLAFHQAIAKASGNMLLRSVSGVIETALVASFTMSSPIHDMALHELNVTSHERIVDAIEARSEEGASAAMLGVIKGLAHWRDLSERVA